MNWECFELSLCRGAKVLNKPRLILYAELTRSRVLRYIEVQFIRGIQFALCAEFTGKTPYLSFDFEI